MKINHVLLIIYLAGSSSVLAVPVKKIFLMPGAAEAGAQSGAVKPLLSLGLGPFSLQLGLQQWAHLQPGTPQVGPAANNLTLPSFNIVVPNVVVNVSSLVMPGGQQAGGSQQTTDGYWIIEAVDAMGNVQTVIVSEEIQNIHNGTGGSGSQTGGSGSQAYEVVEIVENQPNPAPGMTSIRRGVTKLSGVILPPRNTTKPVIQFIKGR